MSKTNQTASVLNKADSGLAPKPRPFDRQGLWSKYGSHEDNIKSVYVQGGRMYSETGLDLLEAFEKTTSRLPESDPRKKWSYIDWVNRNGYILTNDLRSLMVAQRVEEIQRAKYEALHAETERLRQKMLTDTEQELEGHNARLAESSPYAMYPDKDEAPPLELTEAEKILYSISTSPKAVESEESVMEWAFDGDGLEEEQVAPPKVVKITKKVPK